MKLFVTGGAGFIGSALVRHIIDLTPASVVSIDKLTYCGNLDSVAQVSGSARYQFEHLDICNRAALEAAFEHYQPDAVFHLAAETHVDRSIDGPDDFLNTNVLGTARLLDAARAYWARLSSTRQREFRLVHVSTDEVYGDLADSDSLFVETSAYAPSSPYAATKASADHLVRAWGRTYGLPVLITNSSNNYGPCQFPEKLIPHAILNAIAGQPVPVYGDGQHIRDWLYVEDHVRALWKVLGAGRIGETYNVGGCNEHSNLDVVRSLMLLLEEYHPQGAPKEGYASLITFVSDRPGHDVRYAIDAQKIRRELDWAPTETFETGLRKTVRWYLDNPAWWQRVLDGSYRLERLGARGHAAQKRSP